MFGPGGEIARDSVEIPNQVRPFRGVAEINSKTESRGNFSVYSQSNAMSNARITTRRDRTVLVDRIGPLGTAGHLVFQSGLEVGYRRVCRPTAMILGAFLSFKPSLRLYTSYNLLTPPNPGFPLTPFATTTSRHIPSTSLVSRGSIIPSSSTCALV